MKFDHPSLPEIVALQLGEDWREALSRLTAIRKQGLYLLSEVNRAVCLFHLGHFDHAAALAPGLARIYPSELEKYDVNRLMMALLVVAMVAHHQGGNAAEACRTALEICHHFDYRVGDLSYIPTGILRSPDGALTIHETKDAKVIVFVLFCLQFNADITDKERHEIGALLNAYMRLDSSGKTALEVFEEVLLRDDTPYPHIDFDVVRRANRGED